MTTGQPDVAAYTVLDGEGHTIQGPVGGPITFMATAQQTGGAITMFSNLVSPGEGPPLHTHDRESEMWYIVDGSFRFRLGDEVRSVSTGGFVFVPPETPHCFQNAGDAPGNILVMFTPAGMEGFFDDFANVDPDDVSPDTFARLGVPNGMTVVGPPLAVSHPLG